MAVETYLIEEVQGVVTDLAENTEWLAQVENLGLEGQKELLNPAKNCPIPFPKMKANEERVYHILCPTSIEVGKYKGGTMPLRVLAMVALCKQQGWFPLIEVWSDDRASNPILVGFNNEKRWSAEKFIIARWGDELRAYVELEKIATNKKVAEWRNKLAKAIACAESDVVSYVTGENPNLFVSGS